MKNEMVLCTDRKITSFGFRKDFPEGNYFFGFREHLENDPHYRQICTYTLVKVDGKFLVYERAVNGSEKRLSGFDSIGVGGHVNINDACIHSDGCVDIFKTIVLGINRELKEELQLYVFPPASFVGTIALNSNMVDSVHIGVVTVLELQALPESTEDTLCNVRLQSPEELRDNRNLETWSQTLLPYLETF